jgi:hypothetical protein
MQNTKIKDANAETKDIKIKIKKQSNSFVNNNFMNLNTSCSEVS